MPKTNKSKLLAHIPQISPIQKYRLKYHTDFTSLQIFWPITILIYTWASLLSSLHLAATLSSSSLFLPPKATLQPSFDSKRTAPLPMPELPPKKIKNNWDTLADHDSMSFRSEMGQDKQVYTFMQINFIYTNSPRLSDYLYTDQISCFPIQVTKSPR